MEKKNEATRHIQYLLLRLRNQFPNDHAVTQHTDGGGGFVMTTYAASARIKASRRRSRMPTDRRRTASLSD
ncbi:hypothetical protein PybrP1_004993 [[Pythium] brassicae (nom. inval.)]|nr:hypothetical protein PybrP1_004993 [[Pythium] brassicae (nom. inval.)]